MSGEPGRKSALGFLLRVPVPWVFILTYLVGAALESLGRIARFPMTPVASKYTGGVLFLTGGAIAGWGLLIFHKAQTTTVPGEASARLVTWGPYRFTRNPMYCGLILAYLGEAAWLRQIWPVIVLPFMLVYLNWTVIPVEEAKLEEVFPDEYGTYRQQVRRWI